MLKEEILEKIFSHRNVKGIPISHQSMMLTVVEEILYEMKGVNPYATISELLSEPNEQL